jgi:hypothetical protein
LSGLDEILKGDRKMLEDEGFKKLGRPCTSDEQAEVNRLFDEIIDRQALRDSVSTGQFKAFPVTQPGEEPDPRKREVLVRLNAEISERYDRLNDLGALYPMFFNE